MTFFRHEMCTSSINSLHRIFVLLLHHDDVLGDNFQIFRFSFGLYAQRYLSK